MKMSLLYVFNKINVYLKIICCQFFIICECVCVCVCVCVCSFFDIPHEALKHETLDKKNIMLVLFLMLPAPFKD